MVEPTFEGLKAEEKRLQYAIERLNKKLTTVRFKMENYDETGVGTNICNMLDKAKCGDVFDTNLFDGKYGRHLWFVRRDTDENDVLYWFVYTSGTNLKVVYVLKDWFMRQNYDLNTVIFEEANESDKKKVNNMLIDMNQIVVLSTYNENLHMDINRFHSDNTVSEVCEIIKGMVHNIYNDKTFIECVSTIELAKRHKIYQEMCDDLDHLLYKREVR